MRIRRLAPFVLLGLAAAVPGVARAAEPEKSPEKSPGESCTSGSDCDEDATCHEGRCTPKDDAPAPATPGAEPAWADYSIDGTHGFVGVGLGPGASGFWTYKQKVIAKPEFLFALRGGLLFDRAEIGIELAPVTWVPDFEGKPILSFLVSVGGLPALGEHVFWPLRFGLGLAGVNTPNDAVLMQGRVDLIGLAYQYGHLLFELDLPSTRFASDLKTYGIWSWVGNLAVSYLLI